MNPSAWQVIAMIGVCKCAIIVMIPAFVGLGLWLCGRALERE